ncbi:MAG: hypothetical protein KIG14_00860 [Candidatus Sacchiramonaceae bacterium]|nr:hypothetical protein [Candidatus Saccharimonadaceae bacterium]
MNDYEKAVRNVTLHGIDLDNISLEDIISASDGLIADTKLVLSHQKNLQIKAVQSLAKDQTVQDSTLDYFAKEIKKIEDRILYVEKFRELFFSK